MTIEQLDDTFTLRLAIIRHSREINKILSMELCFVLFFSAEAYNRKYDYLSFDTNINWVLSINTHLKTKFIITCINIFKIDCMERKPAFCTCKIKGEDQLSSNCTDDMYL